MNSSLLPFDISPYLTKGSDSGNGVTLMVGDVYTFSLLGGGVVLLIVAVMLVRIMYARAKFFALEFGNGGFFGRAKAIVPSILAGSVLGILGVAALWMGWQAGGYSVTLSAQGVHEITRSDSVRYAWADATAASERIKSDEFMIAFASGSHKCRVQFQQRYIGEKLQDKAIAIADNALAFSKVPRVGKDGSAISAP